MLLSVSCQKKNEGVGSLSFKFPAAPRASGKVGALSVDFSKVCYLANVTGGYINPKKHTSCDIPFGIHTGFQMPETTASLMVPRGIDYNLEIYAYVRTSSTEACPSMQPHSLKGITLTKLHLVGKTKFNVDASQVSVTVDVSDPGADVATQFSMPATCTSASAPGSGGPILVSAGGRRFYRVVDSSDGKRHTSTTNNLGLVLGKDGSR